MKLAIVTIAYQQNRNKWKYSVFGIFMLQYVFIVK